MLAGALMTIPRPRSVWVGHASNAGHVFLSALVAGVVLRLRWRLRGGVHRIDYLIALTVVALLGVGLEVAQIVGPGSPSAKDVGLDLMGGVAALLIAAGTRSQAGWRWGLGAAGAALMMLALSTQLRVVRDAARLWSCWPILADFELIRGSSFLGIDDGARVTLVDAPDGFSKSNGRVAMVTFASGRYPALLVRPLRGDWSKYEMLVFDVYSANESPKALHLRVHDRSHNQRYEDRFNTQLNILSGEQTVRLALREVARGPRGRELDLRSVAALILFMDAPERPVSLYFSNLRLE